ncbi:MAG: hypothetical protein A3F68_12865 [Acidobacteria bacterium RIFCSPLOWO2_12_FULL_54_10]|nr:MAG: hypothetical protein A3F68_12865 [Acidobacteria bacterium RIFCSPLOWO2_12_FULL_54_10]
MNKMNILLVMAVGFLVVSFPAKGKSETIPAGTIVTVRIMDSLDSEINYAGETFRATLDNPLTVDGRVIIHRGAEAIGRLTTSEASGRFRGRSVIGIELTAINFDGKSVAIQTSVYQETSSSRGKETAKLAGIGSVLGSIIGAVAGGKKGTFIGAGIGAAGGAATQTIKGNANVRIPAESMVLFTLQSPTEVGK